MLCLAFFLSGVVLIGCPSSNSVTGDAEMKLSLEQVVPREFDYHTIINAEAIRSNKQLRQQYPEINNISRLLDCDDDISTMWFTGETGMTQLIEGSFEQSTVMESLVSGYDLRQSDYKGFTVWVWKDLQIWLFIKDNMLIFGYNEEVKRCLDVIQSQQGSLLQDDAFVTVSNQLPSNAVYYQFARGRFLNWWDYEGLEYGGYCIEFDNTSVVTLTSVCQFADSISAEAAMEEMSAEMADYLNFDWRDVEALREGKLVKVSAQFSDPELLLAKLFDVTDSSFQ